MPSQLEVLDEEIASLFAEVFAVTARAIEKLAEFDRLEAYGALGFQSTAHYLNWRVGLSVSAARDHVRVARALEKLPRVREKFSAGTLSFSKVRALTRIATPENEEVYLVVANDTSASQLEKIVRACRRVTLDEARKQIDGRGVEMGFGEDGMFVLRARLTPEEGARLMHAVDAAVPKDQTRSWEERRADALVALAAGPAASVELVVHVDASSEVLSAPASDAERERGGQVETPRAERVAVAHETARRLACDASVVVMEHDNDGSVLNVGRRTRQISTALRRALATRDGGCRYPGCANHIVDRHHVHHWADGGETKLSNLLQLCSFHHTRLHEGGFGVELGADGSASFVDAHGRAIGATAAMPAARGIEWLATSADGRLKVVPWQGPPWSSRRIDYGYVVSCLVS